MEDWLYDPIERARFILEQGPLTREEYTQLPEGQLEDYVEAMSYQLERRGLQGFVEAKDLLRPAVFAEVLNDPPTF